MRVVIQKVSEASVTIHGTVRSSIGKGLLVLVGIEETDMTDDIHWLSGKICRLRIFPDQEGILNLSVTDVQGEVLVVSQFTLHASTKKGNRPSYIRAARPEIAVPLYEQLIKRMETEMGKPVKTGQFGAMIEVSLINDGPVTIIMDSKDRE